MKWLLGKEGRDIKHGHNFQELKLGGLYTLN